MSNVQKAMNIIINENYAIDNTYYNYEILDYLEQIVNYYSKHFQLTQLIKTRIEDYLVKLDNVEYINRDIKNKIVKLKSLLDKQNIQDSMSFYKLEILIRTNKLKNIFVSDKEIDNKRTSIDISISNDCYVLFIQSDLITDKEFFESYLDNLINNEYYIESLNSIINNCPEILKNSTFYSRTLYVLSVYDKKQTKNIQKEINKILKIKY